MAIQGEFTPQIRTRTNPMKGKVNIQKDEFVP